MKNDWLWSLALTATALALLTVGLVAANGPIRSPRDAARLGKDKTMQRQPVLVPTPAMVMHAQTVAAQFTLPRTNHQPVIIGTVTPFQMLSVAATGQIESSSDLRTWTVVPVTLRFGSGFKTFTTNLPIGGGGLLLITNYFSNSPPILYYRLLRTQ